ncbi:hypothetical protein NPIL_332831 [Nephila pilipes]|uniref:Uncharacterized protein n=1 Tax=Nephila pilipes TaxID=299642 RepID=A0A8X6QZP9_NEPPI|nr:hypothetical protein NPIL_332831 [Nephila pilipes]
MCGTSEKVQVKTVRSPFLIAQTISSCFFHGFDPIQELSKRRYYSDDEVKTTSQVWLSDIGRDFFAKDMEKRIHCLDKCLNNGSSYFENRF